MTSDSTTRFASVRADLETACLSASRNPAHVVLLAVSKGHPASAIRSAYATGQRDFGENYVQELVDKAKDLADLEDLRWHFIGHLQSNKAKDVAHIAHAFHAADRMKIVDELAKRRDPASPALETFVEVNVAGEAQKSGCAPKDAEDLARRIVAHPNLRLAGLMTVPPAADDEATGRCFDELATLRDAIAKNVGVSLGLSMGMSADYELAIARGSTCVRIGTALFGPRPPKVSG